MKTHGVLGEVGQRDVDLPHRRWIDRFGRDRVVHVDHREAVAGENLGVVGDLILVAGDPSAAMNPDDGQGRWPSTFDLRRIEDVQIGVTVVWVVALIAQGGATGGNVPFERTRHALPIPGEGVTDEQRRWPGRELECNEDTGRDNEDDAEGPQQDLCRGWFFSLHVRCTTLVADVTCRASAPIRRPHTPSAAQRWRGERPRSTRTSRPGCGRRCTGSPPAWWRRRTCRRSRGSGP